MSAKCVLECLFVEINEIEKIIGASGRGKRFACRQMSALPKQLPQFTSSDNLCKLQSFLLQLCHHYSTLYLPVLLLTHASQVLAPIESLIVRVKVVSWGRRRASADLGVSDRRCRKASSRRESTNLLLNHQRYRSPPHPPPTQNLSLPKIYNPTTRPSLALI